MQKICSPEELKELQQKFQLARALTRKSIADIAKELNMSAGSLRVTLCRGTGSWRAIEHIKKFNNYHLQKFQPTIPAKKD